MASFDNIIILEDNIKPEINKDTHYILVEKDHKNFKPFNSDFSGCINIFATVHSGYKVAMNKLEVESNKGFPVDLFNIEEGIMIPGNLITHTLFNKPKNITWDIWIPIFLRNNNILIRTMGENNESKRTYEEVQKGQEKYAKRYEVGIITPTYNRHDHLSKCFECIKAQEGSFVKSMEWCILDDSPKPMSKEDQENIWGKSNINVFYVYLPSKVCVGNKRNILARLSLGKILVNFDDDDLHHPERCKASVHKLSHSTVDICGCTDCYLIHKSIIYQIRGLGQNHSTAGLMAYTRNHGLTHKFGEDMHHAEESEFTDKYKLPMVQLDPNKVILIISHENNTYDKTNYLKQNINKTVFETKLKIKNFTRNKKLIKLYINNT